MVLFKHRYCASYLNVYNHTIAIARCGCRFFQHSLLDVMFSVQATHLYTCAVLLWRSHLDTLYM